MDIGKTNDNFKDRKSKYFNCNKYRHMAKEYRLKKKECETRKCFKCEKEEHIAKDCKGTQSIKNKRFKRNQITKKMRRKSRVLTTISSRHSTRDLLYKFPE